MSTSCSSFGAVTAVAALSFGFRRYGLAAYLHGSFELRRIKQLLAHSHELLRVRLHLRLGIHEHLFHLPVSNAPCV